MYNKNQQKNTSLVWRCYSRKNYAMFASLGRQIRIGVLSIATLGTVSPVLAVQHAQNTAVFSADEKELEEVTVNGSMAPLTQLQSARIVSVITRTEIEQAGVQSVNDLFKLCSSVDVRQRGNFGIQTDMSIDGGTYEQITVLLNGVNINNPHTGHLTADLPVSVQDIERIEILQGAASRIYGGQAFGGAINIVTKQDTARSLTIGAQGGSYGSVLGGGRITMSHNTIKHHLSGMGGRSDGETLNSAWKKGQLFYQGSMNHETMDLNWQFGFSRKDYGANTFYSGSSNDQWEQNERYLISISAESKGKIHFIPTAYWNRTYDNYQWHKGTPNNSHRADVYGIRLGAYTTWFAGRTALSTELRQEGILSSALGTLMDEADHLKAHGADKIYTKRSLRTNVSYNLEHNIILDRWTISAGILANYNTAVSHNFRFYPGADVAYRPTDKWKLFLGYNMGFRLPSFTDLYYNSPDITGNSQLKAEENHSLSIGATYDPTPGLHAQTRLFYSHGKNLIDYVKRTFGDAAHADNFNLDNMGASIEVGIKFRQLIDQKCWFNTLTTSYTYIHQRRQGKYPIFTSLYASDYLRHKLTVNLNHRIWGALSATWSLRYQERMGSYQKYEGLKPTSLLQKYNPYATLDLKLQWTKPHYEIFIQGTNLTNNHYQDLGNIPQPGLWLMAGAHWTLNL